MLTDKQLLRGLQLLLFWVLGLSILGGVRWYTPVPFGDMWLSYINFDGGAWATWWAQHNEHRILLARVLFLLDRYCFGGALWFLIAANYALVGLSAYLFNRILMQVSALQQALLSRQILGLWLTAWLFLWMQWENLTWGFQSQFFLAQLLPLAAFYQLQQAVDKPGQWHFILACVLGVLAMGTMANGILALPLMTLYILLLRQSWNRIGTLVLLSAGMLYYYLHDYATPLIHGTLSQALHAAPWDVLYFVLLYLGSPFYYLFGGKIVGKLFGGDIFLLPLTAVMGLILVLATLAALRRWLLAPQRSALELALLFFVFYITATAIGTAGGRLLFGLKQAIVSRYTTPALMAWAALMVLYLPAMLLDSGVRRQRLIAVFVLLAVLMLPLQAQSLLSFYGWKQEQRVAALALAMRIKDQGQISYIYPPAETQVAAVDSALELAANAVEEQRSIFGRYPLRGVRESWAQKFVTPALPTCQGRIERVESIALDPRFVRVRGWLFAGPQQSAPDVIRFLDQRGQLQGYALAGFPHLTWAEHGGPGAQKAAFLGYLASEQLGQHLQLQGERQGQTQCQLAADIPAEPQPFQRSIADLKNRIKNWAQVSWYQFIFEL